MRLWHYKLIPYLPKKQLVSQWRELVAIKRQWEKGTLIRPLVSYVTTYDKKYYLNYLYRLTLALTLRNIDYKKALEDEIIQFCGYDNFKPRGLELYNAVYDEHNDEYLEICYFNLKEKYIRGIIPEEEWKILDEFYKEEML